MQNDDSRVTPTTVTAEGHCTIDGLGCLVAAVVVIVVVLLLPQE